MQLGLKGLVAEFLSEQILHMASKGIMGTDSVSIVFCLGSRHGHFTTIDSRRDTMAVFSTLVLPGLCLFPDCVLSLAPLISGSMWGWQELSPLSSHVERDLAAN